MITKAALLLFRERNDEKELMFVRAHGKPYFILPGGKKEDGEEMEDALQRELREELKTDAQNIQLLGVVDGHTPDGRPLQMHLYSAKLVGEPQPSAEIKEVVWIGKGEVLGDAASTMTPMTLEKILPFLDMHKMWE